MLSPELKWDIALSLGISLFFPIILLLKHCK